MILEEKKMQYNIDMQIKDMLEDQRCIEVMNRFLPGIAEKIQANPMGEPCPCGWWHNLQRG